MATSLDETYTSKPQHPRRFLRMRGPISTLLTAALLTAGAAALGAQTASVTAKKPLDHDSYKLWKTLGTRAMSSDGQWLAYSTSAEKKDADLFVKSLVSDKTYQFTCAGTASFDASSRFLIYTIKPAVNDKSEDTKCAKKKDDKAPAPKDGMAIVDLKTGAATNIERVKAFKMAKESKDAKDNPALGFLAYQLEEPETDKDKDKDKKDGDAKPEEGAAPAAEPAAEKTAKTEEPKEPAKEPGKEPSKEGSKETKEAAAKDDAKDKKKKDKKDGTVLVLRNLAKGTETRFEKVSSFDFTKSGRWLMYTTTTKDGKGDGIVLYEIATGKSFPVASGNGTYASVVFDDKEEQIAFVSDREDVEAEQPASKVYYARLPNSKTKSKDAQTIDVQPLIAIGAAGIPAGWWVTPSSRLEFSNSGARLFFDIQARPEVEKKDDKKKDEKKDDEEVVVDVWNWKDTQLQTEQLKKVGQDKNRSFRAMMTLADKRIIQLADEELPSITVGNKGDADIALGTLDTPYQQRKSWDNANYVDVYLVDVKTGKRKIVFRDFEGQVSLSPESRYMTWWNVKDRCWYSMAVDNGKPINLTASIPYPMFSELHDQPSDPGSYGSAGWTPNDANFLVYDKHDIWVLDPSGKQPPRNMTEGVGRAENLRIRYATQFDADEERTRGTIDPKLEMLLNVTNLSNLDDGYYTDRFNGTAKPKRLIMSNFKIGRPDKAKKADRLLFTRESFQEFPNLWVSDRNFGGMRKLTNVNPQQSEFRWGTTELVSWLSLDGVKLDGVLYKPEGFDPNKKYPMILNFYERSSGQLNNYQVPHTMSANICIPCFVSREYIVFVPDIQYRVGLPGESALRSVVPGVEALIEKGFVDKKRIGMQGHSWGGYEVTYMITRTDLFAAALAGAPVSNMISAYGGIRYGAGISRMFQYEKTQSRIGGSLWEYPQRFIENSPIFGIDNVKTPLLILHNDNDGAVPFTQGIELFVAGRRLGKPMWMLNYNKEDHGVSKSANKRDFTIRATQFFDHYLKGEPAPVWMEKGIAASAKGKMLGYEPANAEEKPAMVADPSTGSSSTASK